MPMQVICALDFLQNYRDIIILFGAALTFAWSIITVVINWRKAKLAADFNNYHKLIEKLVGSADKNEELKLDCQVAIVYELRNFRRYDEVTFRILSNLEQYWEESSGVNFQIA